MTIFNRFILALLGLFIAHASSAENVDLATVPARDSVELTIYNSEDLTLVRETRLLSFRKGENSLQFSWANTRIDPTSVTLKFAAANRQPGQRLSLAHTRFPHASNEVVYWSVESEFDGEAMVEISYFTSGITWKAEYDAIASEDESDVALTGYVRVENNSGEDYEDAKVRLVVGEINLVERIAALLGIRGTEYEIRQKMERKRLIEEERRQHARRAMMDAVSAYEAMPAAAPQKAKQILKQGQSEYFIYTVDGRETLNDRSAKRLRSFRAESAKLKVEYRLWPERYGAALNRLYLTRNDAASGLGETPLPNGLLRVFKQTESGDLRYLAKQTLKYVPIGDQIEMLLGEDPELILSTKTVRHWRDRIFVKYGRADVLQRVDQPRDRRRLKVDHNARVVGWDRHSETLERIKNVGQRAAHVSLRRRFSGDVLIDSERALKKHDNHSVQIDIDVPAGGEIDWVYTLTSREGKNQKQQSLEITRRR